ncbi:MULTISPECIES: PepSY domain-containing protein [unclassified Janthinobacterium]|uniref:PepSY-associated TM helix domain-containing protein n=1 Tax=unclassified Janthinobacterium TaxID=2610881 RepID=UPI001619F4E3|nr:MULTISPECIES: PepSY-associated TM helix domain-containing protein [unclassified Janthinobacterium]MBB5367655.1 putative iron-regulated membrane protein [Janthinobacterium sp. K2C7]MBB5379867.1 putative iron-regulated membrane protein [Janthinobacterium sp. K2Li3]MBB5386037.1 putative iron-regulated membrane protein [Janthinobacterium sp. K2E3]
MKEGFRQSMAWLHTWSGLLVCWILLLVFCAGTASYYRNEITIWMQPELHGAAASKVTTEAAATAAQQAMQERAQGAPRWFISLPGERTPATQLGWSKPSKPGEKKRGRRGNFHSEMADPATGDVLSKPRETRGGEFLYRLHFDLHYMSAIWGRWIVGFCAMFMLVSIISGIVTHKRIFKDLFTFRPKKGQRSWLDAHNVTAVLALPYHLMITYTGLVTLMFLYMPSGATAAYKGDQDTFFAEAFPGGSNDRKVSGVAAPLTPFAPLVRQAEQHWGGKVERISVNHPGDANAVITLSRAAGRDMSSKQPSMDFDGVSGRLLSTNGDELPGASATHGVMYGLHIAHFGGPLLRALFFLSGLAGCAMVATGALLWAVKTRQKQAKALAAGKRPSFGLRLVEALNIGAIAGIPIAFGAYFWANRLLTVGMENRPQEEIACFFGAWALVAIVAQLRPSRAMWRIQLAAGAFLFCALPVLNIFTTESHLGVTLFMGQGPVSVAAFDLVVLVLGLGLVYAAWKLKPLPTKAVKTAAATKPAAPAMEAA